MQIISKQFALETTCIECESLFSRENKENINLSSGELAERVVDKG